MENQRISIQSSHYRVHPCQMHYRNTSPIPNPNPDSDLVPYYPEMLTHKDLDLDPDERVAQGNHLISFVIECVGESLEDQS